MRILLQQKRATEWDWSNAAAEWRRVDASAARVLGRASEPEVALLPAFRRVSRERVRRRCRLRLSSNCGSFWVWGGAHVVAVAVAAPIVLDTRAIPRLPFVERMCDSLFDEIKSYTALPTNSQTLKFIQISPVFDCINRRRVTSIFWKLLEMGD